MTQTLLRIVLVLVPFAAFAAGGTAPDKPKPGANIHLRAGPEQTQALFDAIARADEALFSAFFDTCDVDKVAGMVTDDLEFFHDKDGLSITSGPQFVEAMKGKCARQRSGEDFLSKRVLVKESLKVYPLNHYGAVEVGVHRFYAVVEGQPDRLTEVSQFTQVWKDDGGVWKLARVVSYDHKLAAE
jgi:hypothetical protein